MPVDIFLGEPSAYIKQWIIDHRPIPPSITVNYENGTSVEVSSPFTSTKIASLQAADVVSLTVPDGAEISDEQGLFINCGKLSEITFGDTTYVPEDIETKVSNWSLGLDSEGNAHLVVLYYGNGVVVVNDGERGFKVDWDKFVARLENFDNSVLPEVGKSIIVPYKVDPNGEAVDTEWMILGYNKDIPRFVKYKDKTGNRVYMDVLPGTSLLATFEGANVYSSKDGTDLIGTVSDTGGTSFTFGNNNTYSVPRTITVNRTVYTFCGYNVTLQSKYGLAAKFEGSFYDRSQFISQYRNDWKTSEIRKWLNGTKAVVTHQWYRSSDGATTTGTIVGLLGRLSDQNFTGNIIPTVTRTWVYPSWRTDQSVEVENYVDKFRLLGVGEVNCKGTKTTEHFPDGGVSVDGENKGYDTSRFGEVFNETDILVKETSRERKTMKEDGSEGSACNWWLRSARSDSSNVVGYVYRYGHVNFSGATNGNAVLPVCLIG